MTEVTITEVVEQVRVDINEVAETSQEAPEAMQVEGDTQGTPEAESAVQSDTERSSAMSECASCKLGA